MKEWSLSHGYDGFSLSLSTRKYSKIITENIYDKLMDLLGHPCCANGIWKYVLRGEWGSIIEFRFLNNKLTNWYSTDENHKTFPVPSFWVKETFPEIFDPTSDDYWESIMPFIEDDRDPDHGVKCPKCGAGRVNNDPEKQLPSMVIAFVVR